MSPDYFRPTVAFDIDDTLLDYHGEVRQDVLQLFLLLQKFGCEMYLWSNGGGPSEDSISYALRIRAQLGIDAQIREKGSFRPDITVDDLDMFDRISEGTLGRVNLKV